MRISSRVRKVILVYPKVDYENDYPCHWTPFGLLSIAKAIRDKGLVEVVISDGNQKGQMKFIKFLRLHIPDALCCGFSIMTGGNQITHALDAATKIKQLCPSLPLVWGGPHVNILPDQTLKHPLVDAVLLGPGQISIPAYLEALSGSRPFETVPGLRMKNNEGFIKGPDNMERIQDFGGYPWDLIRVKDYIRKDPTIAERSLNYVSSQGCPYTCQFCYEQVYKRKYSYMPADQLIKDILDLQKRFGITGIKFYDADFFWHLGRVRNFAEGLIQKRVKLGWAASAHPFDIIRARKLSSDFLELVSTSGCKRILMGAESGSDRVLTEIIKKGVSRNQIVEVATLIAQHNIIGSFTFIIGFPGESYDEINATLQLSEDLKQLSPRSEAKVHVYAPYPGTTLYQEALRMGFTPPRCLEGWSKFNYYESMTPWTNSSTALAARTHTEMIR